VYNKSAIDFANNHRISDLYSPTGTYCDTYKIGYITAWVEAHTSTGTPFDMKLLTVNRTGSTKTILIVAVPILAPLVAIAILPMLMGAPDALDSFILQSDGTQTP
jgi:hypothetical protein